MLSRLYADLRLFSDHISLFIFVNEFDIFSLGLYFSL